MLFIAPLRCYDEVGWYDYCCCCCCLVVVVVSECCECLLLAAIGLVAVVVVLVLLFIALSVANGRCDCCTKLDFLV